MVVLLKRGLLPILNEISNLQIGSLLQGSVFIKIRLFFVNQQLEHVNKKQLDTTAYYKTQKPVISHHVS